MNKTMKSRLLMAALALVLTATATATGTLAYLNARSDSDVQNTFTPAGDSLLTRTDAFVLKEHQTTYAAEGRNELDGTLGAHQLTKTTEGEVSNGQGSAANTYFALPGAAMEKDPFVRIDPKGKTEVPAYVYIEVEGELFASEEDALNKNAAQGKENNNVSLVGQIDPSNWKLLEGVQGPHSGRGNSTKVYQLVVGGAPVRVYTKEGDADNLYYQTVSGNGLGQESKFSASTFHILKDNKIRIAANRFNAIPKGSENHQNRAAYELTFYGYMAQAYNVDGAACFTTAFLSGASGAEPEPGEGGGGSTDMGNEMMP